MKFTVSHLLFSFIFYIGISVWAAPAYAETKASSATVTLKSPPISLEQWYKPANKRQVWLHTMFRLRREMQAIAEYAEINNQAAMEKWIKRLDKDYNKIAEMVPEWEDEIRPRLLSELKMFAEKGDSYRVGKTLEMIEDTCNDCHENYQPLVTALYRSPHYNEIKVKNTGGSVQSFEDNMEQLSSSLNRVLIALDDNDKPRALNASKNLANQLHSLSGSCDTCHKDDAYPQQRILGEDTQQRFDRLQGHIEKGQVKDSQKLMGEIAVTVCARCHNTHRIVSDLRNALLPAD